MTPPAHSIRTEASPVGPVVVVSGEADAGAAAALDDALRAAMLGAVADGSSTTIVVDLSETTLIDSRTIGVLTSWLEQLRAKGWRLPVVCTDPNLRRLFRLIGLEQAFSFSETREEALRQAAP